MAKGDRPRSLGFPLPTSSERDTTGGRWPSRTDDHEKNDHQPVGLVEAGLVGTLTVAGVAAADALAATLLYRIVSYWLPLPAGGIAYLLFSRRYGQRRS